MLVCPGCERHVFADAERCPFCSEPLATTSAGASSNDAIALGSKTTLVSISTMTGLIVGLTLLGCGDKENDDAATASATDSVGDDNGEAVAAYGDPSDTWDTNDTLPGTSSTSTSSTTGDTTDTSSTSTDTTGTDDGTETGATGTDSGGTDSDNTGSEGSTTT